MSICSVAIMSHTYLLIVTFLTMTSYLQLGSISYTCSTPSCPVAGTRIPEDIAISHSDSFINCTSIHCIYRVMQQPFYLWIEFTALFLNKLNKFTVRISSTE